jgi:hypothetical protein
VEEGAAKFTTVVFGTGRASLTIIDEQRNLFRFWMRMFRQISQRFSLLGVLCGKIDMGRFYTITSMGIGGDSRSNTVLVLTG